MKKLLLTIILLCAAAFAQAPQRNQYGPLSQGAVINIPNIAGSQAVSFEYVYSATPGAASITIAGCMRGKDSQPGQAGTCDAAVDTYAGTTNSIRSPGFAKVYDTFQITVTTLTGATLTVNSTVVVSKSGTSNNGGFGAVTATSVTSSGTVSGGTFSTATNCSSSAAPAVCGTAAAGSVVVAAGATTVTVNTTAVTANSQIFVMPDDSLNAKLSVTCNTTAATLSADPWVSARTAATSFVITVSAAPAVNPECFSYFIVN